MLYGTQASVVFHLIVLIRREADAPIIQGEVALVDHFLTGDLKYVLLMLPWPPTHHGSRHVPRISRITQGLHLLCWAPYLSGSLTGPTAAKLFRLGSGKSKAVTVAGLVNTL